MNMLSAARRYRDGITPSFLLSFLDMCESIHADRISDIIPCLTIDATTATRETVFDKLVNMELLTVDEFDHLCHKIFKYADAGTVSALFESNLERFASFMFHHFCEHMRSSKYLQTILRHLQSYCPTMVASLGKLRTDDGEGIPLCMYLFGQLHSQADFVRGQVIPTLTHFCPTFPIHQQVSKRYKQNMLHILFMGTDVAALLPEHISLVRSLLYEYKVDPNQQDRFGNTAFHYLAQCSKAQLVYRYNEWCHRKVGGGGGGSSGGGTGRGLLLSSDLCANSRFWTQCRTMLNDDGCGHEIYHQLVELMLDAGADPSIANRHGRSPLVLLAALGRYDAFRFVLDRCMREEGGDGAMSSNGASLLRQAFQPDRDGATIYHWLCARSVRIKTSDPCILTLMQDLTAVQDRLGIDPFHANRDGMPCFITMFTMTMAPTFSLQAYVLDLLRLFGPRITRGGDIFYWITHALVTHVKHEVSLNNNSPESLLTNEMLHVARDIFAYLFVHMESPDDFKHAVGPGKNTPLHLVVQVMPSPLDHMIQWFVETGHANIDAENSRKQTPRSMSAALRHKRGEVSPNVMSYLRNEGAVGGGMRTTASSSSLSSSSSSSVDLSSQQQSPQSP